MLALAKLDLPELKSGPSTALRAGQVLLALRAAGIHYSDVGLINGTYGRTLELPAIGGREGVGEVVALGPGVLSPAVGTLVKMPEDLGVWREALVAEASSLYPIPAGVPLEQAALAFVNPPTAWRMLHDFVALQKGDWLMLNAGTSAVGVLVAQLAQHLGWRVLSVVRDEAKAGSLRELGAVVVGEESGYEKNPGAWTGGAPIRLALNAIGGPSAGRLCRAVAPGGVVVTYGGVTSDPMRFPTRELIFRNLALRGYWMDAWARARPVAEVHALWDKMIELLREGIITQPVAAQYPLIDWKAAFEHAFRPGHGGKVLLTSEWKPKNGG